MSGEPYTPENVPPDTDEYIYRWVTRAEPDMGMGLPLVRSVLKQIRISQP